MALERKPQNLRGYGLAQDPTKELDYTFVADQNRRNAQDKSIGAREEAQKKNLAQRDKEARLALLKGIPTLETNWSPEIKNKINTEIEGFVGSARGLSNEQIIVGLSGLNSKANAYKSIGTALKTRATEVATGKTFAGEGGEKLLGLGYEEDFASMDFDEAMAEASGEVGSQFAPMPDMSQWETLKNNLYDVTKSSSKGRMEYSGNLGDKSYGRFAHDVDPNGKTAAVSNFMMGNRGFYNLYAEKNELSPKEIESTLSSQIDDVVFDKWAENRPRADKDEFKPTYKTGGGSNDTHSFSVTDNFDKETPANASTEQPTDKAWQTVDIAPQGGKTLKTGQVKDADGNNITATVTGVTNKNGTLEIIASRRANPTEMYKRVSDAVDGFSDLTGDDKDKAYIEAIEDESLNISTEITERFDYERNKHLVTASKMDIYKMLGDVRAYKTPEEIKEDGFTYLAKEDGGNPISIDDLHKTFLNEKRKGDTFGEYIKKFDYLPQEGDMPNVDAAKVKKGSNKEKSNTYGI
jgi:hypothetical protein